MKQTIKIKLPCFRIIILILTILVFQSCNEPGGYESNELLNQPFTVSESGVDAIGPFFTTDQHGYPLIVWSEKLNGGDETGYVVKYSKFSREGDEISYTREVTASRGCSSTSESMNKIAVKKDGTMVSVFSRRTPTENNMFAGALFYSQSFDDGRTWTNEKYLHIRDTTKGPSRSFFDIATLPDGEIGAIWLDSRLTKEHGDGSTLFFAKTEGDAGFLTDKVIATGTCECCRTDLFVSENGDTHALYRDVWQDSIRDISHVITRDNGKSFSQSVRINIDDWVIYGCPHTGPSMCEYGNQINIVWFTMGGGPGLYHNRFDNEKHTYSKKQLLTRKGSHPQILTTGKGEIVFLWEEGEATQVLHNHKGHTKPDASVSLNSISKPSSIIKAQVWQNNTPVREHWVSLPDRFAQLPVGIKLPDGFIGVAWIQQNEDKSYSVMYRRLSA